MIPASHATECADIVTSSEDYARRFAGEVGAWMVETQSQIVEKMLSGRGWKDAIDVGGGHGQLVRPLRSALIQPTILGSADICGRRIERERSNGECAFSVGALTEIPFAENSFDLATCIRFISHCEDWKKLIRELCRVARHGVLIDYPPLLSSNIIAPITFRIKKLIEGNTRPFSIFTHAEIFSEFEHNGFRLAARHGQFFFPMAIHRLFKNRGFSQALEGTADALRLRREFGSPVIALFTKSA